MSISEFVDIVFSLLFWIMFIRVFLTWIPSIDWYKQPFSFLKSVADPIFAPFKTFIPPIGGLDLSPIAAFLFLGVVQVAVIRTLNYFGL